MTTDSSILAWRIPWAEEPGGLQSMGSHRVGHDWTHTAHLGADYTLLPCDVSLQEAANVPLPPNRACLCNLMQKFRIHQHSSLCTCPLPWECQPCLTEAPHLHPESSSEKEDTRWSVPLSRPTPSTRLTPKLQAGPVGSLKPGPWLTRVHWFQQPQAALLAQSDFHVTGPQWAPAAPGPQLAPTLPMPLWCQGPSGSHRSRPWRTPASAGSSSPRWFQWMPVPCPPQLWVASMTPGSSLTPVSPWTLANPGPWSLSQPTPMEPGSWQLSDSSEWRRVKKFCGHYRIPLKAKILPIIGVPDKE